MVHVVFFVILSWTVFPGQRVLINLIFSSRVMFHGMSVPQSIPLCPYPLVFSFFPGFSLNIFNQMLLCSYTVFPLGQVLRNEIAFSSVLTNDFSKRCPGLHLSIVLKKKKISVLRLLGVSLIACKVGRLYRPVVFPLLSVACPSVLRCLFFSYSFPVVCTRGILSGILTPSLF